MRIGKLRRSMPSGPIPELKCKADASQSPAAEGVDAAISALVEVECNRVLSQKITKEEEQSHADPAREAQEKELNA